MSRRHVAFIAWAAVTAMLLGCSLGGLFGGQPAATATPTKTFVPTFTATPLEQASPTATPEPTETAEPTTPAEPPTPTEPPTATPGPPTSTPRPPAPAPTATPRPPQPTNTPQPAYEYDLVQEPQKDWCWPESGCTPAINGYVLDAQGNPVARYAVTVKLDSPAWGVQYCAVGDESKMLQPGQFKFECPPSGVVPGVYKLTVVANDRSTPLSQTYEIKGVSQKSNHHGIIFRHK